MELDSGRMKNPKTGGNWEEDKEPVEIYDVA